MTSKRSTTNEQRSTNKRRRSKKQRFNSPSLAVLNPRTLLTGKSSRRRKVNRFAWLRRVKQRTWNLTHVAAALILIVAIVTMVYGFASIDFWVYSARIENNRYTPPDQVYRQAGIHGYSIFFLDPTEIRERLMALEHVRDSDITIALPAEVRIHLVEREPTILYQVLGESHWVDEEGVISPAADERSGLIKLIDDSAAASSDGRHVDIAVLNAIRHITGRLPQVDTFRYQDPYGLYFISPEGWRVYLGSASSMEDKLSNWESIRKRVLQEPTAVQEIDLRYDRPYWR